MFHQNDDAPDADDEIHGPAHTLHHPTRDHPVCEITVLGHLHRSEDRNVNMPSADHPEGLRAVEIARRWQLGDRLFAGINEVRILFALERERTHAEHAVLTLQLNGDACRYKVRHESRDADAEIDIEAILQLCRGTARHFVARPGHIACSSCSISTCAYGALLDALFEG